MLQDHCIYQFIAVRLPTRHLYTIQLVSVPAWNEEGLMIPSPIALLTADGFLEKWSQFSLRVRPMVGQPCSSGWAHTQDYMATKN